MTGSRTLNATRQQRKTMQKTTLTLEAGRRKMHDSLRTIDDLLSTTADEQSCWTALLAVRQLECARQHQIHLLSEYQKHFSGKHWTVNIVLNLVLEQKRDTGVRVRNILDNLYRQLQSQEATLSILLERQLHAMSVETQATLDVELKVLYRMLDMLNFTPRRPASRPELRVLK